jgi:hypothetical protein
MQLEEIRQDNALQRKSHLCIPFFWELRGLSPDFHTHVPVSDLFIPRIGPHISCSRIGRSILGIYKSLTDIWMWKMGLWPRNSFSGKIYFKLYVSVLCSVNPSSPAPFAVVRVNNGRVVASAVLSPLWQQWPQRTGATEEFSTLKCIQAG